MHRTVLHFLLILKVAIYYYITQHEIDTYWSNITQIGFKVLYVSALKPLYCWGISAKSSRANLLWFPYNPTLHEPQIKLQRFSQFTVKNWYMTWIYLMCFTKVTGTNNSGQVLDAPAHLLSRALMSQSASVAYCLSLCNTLLHLWWSLYQCYQQLWLYSTERWQTYFH
jgi:hypothetical protein